MAYYVVICIQSLGHVWLFATPWTAAHQAFLSITISWSLLRLMYIVLVMPINHLVLCHPLFLLPSIFPSTRVFSNELALCIMWPKYWSFSFSNSLPMNIQDWFPLGLTDFISLQSSLLWHHSSKASILWRSAFFMVQHSHPYMTYWKNHSFD